MGALTSQRTGTSKSAWEQSKHWTFPNPCDAGKPNFKKRYFGIGILKQFDAYNETFFKPWDKKQCIFFSLKIVRSDPDAKLRGSNRIRIRKTRHYSTHQNAVSLWWHLLSQDLFWTGVKKGMNHFYGGIWEGDLRFVPGTDSGSGLFVDSGGGAVSSFYVQPQP